MIATANQYQWAPTYYAAIPAEVAAAEFERLKDLNGGELTPRMVLDSARDPESPLHKAFNWDDASAAERYRLSQARRLISKLVIIREGSPEPAIVHVSLKTDEGRSFREAREVAKSEPLKKLLLQQAGKEFKAMRQRYNKLRELEKVWVEVDQALQGIAV